MPKNYVCILAGGSGERFWPLSRIAKPKHLVSLVTASTLLEQTVERVASCLPLENIIVLTSAHQLQDCRRVLHQLKPEQIIAEPEKRDTSAACALGTAIIHQKDPTGVVAFLAADAMVKNGTLFVQQLKECFRRAGETDCIITLGIRPSHPSTRFGYLEVGEVDPGSNLKCFFFKVKRFAEKPDLETAKVYFESEGFLWNAGIFVWKTTTFINESRQYSPHLATFVDDYLAHSQEEGWLAKAFAAIPKISIDYALMERTGSVLVADAKFDWDDVGSWTALPTHLPPDPHGNTIQGEVVTYASKRNIVLTQKNLIALCGVEDLIIVETPDATLVCHRNAAEQIKMLQALLPERVR